MYTTVVNYNVMYVSKYADINVSQNIYAKHKISNPIVERLILIRIVYQFNYRNIRNIYSKAVKSLRGYNILPFVPAILMCAVPCRSIAPFYTSLPIILF